MKPSSTQQEVDNLVSALKDSYSEGKVHSRSHSSLISALNQARRDNGEVIKPTADIHHTTEALVSMAEDTSVDNITYWQAIGLANMKDPSWASDVLHRPAYNSGVSYDNALAQSKPMKVAVANESLVKREVLGTKNKSTVNALMNRCKKGLDRSTRLTKLEKEVEALKVSNEKVLSRLDYHEKVMPVLKQGQTIQDLAEEMLLGGMSAYSVNKELQGGISYATIKRIKAKQNELN